MEIERKYLIHTPPADYQSYSFHQIEQGYLSIDPVVRVRREDETYYLTYKSKGLLAREEYNLPLTKEAYKHLILKADGNILTKKRYLIPLQDPNAVLKNLIIELDIFEGRFKGLILAEVEFASTEDANNFIPPDWFGEEVTYSGQYQNSHLSTLK